MNESIILIIQFENETSLTHWLRLPDEIKFQVDDALVQLESAYFQDLVIIRHKTILHLRKVKTEC